VLHQRWQFTPARRAVLAVRRALCMIDPTVEEVGLRRMPVAVAVASLTAVARAARGHDAVAGCGGGDTGSEYRA
jgi:hypothetical protein